MNAKNPMMNWQSMRSVMPPWPGMESPKSLILNVRLRPEAKKPPKGAISDAKVANTKMWNCIGLITISISAEACKRVYKVTYATVTVVGRCVQLGGIKGKRYIFAIKTGLTSHCRPVKMLAPRSYTRQTNVPSPDRRALTLTGQMKYL